MSLKKEIVEEFQELIRAEYGRELTSEQAETQAKRLLDFLKAILERKKPP